jgi:hypothetical protein
MQSQSECLLKNGATRELGDRYRALSVATHSAREGQALVLWQSLRSTILACLDGIGAGPFYAIIACIIWAWNR